MRITVVTLIVGLDELAEQPSIRQQSVIKKNGKRLIVAILLDIGDSALQTGCAMPDY